MPRLLGIVADALAAALAGAIQLWVRVLGRSVSPEGEPWLAGPIGTRDAIGPGFYKEFAAAHGLTVRTGDPDAGLLPDFSRLAGPTFEPGRVHPEVVRFYERTARYQLDAWSQWSSLFRPFGWVLISLVSRRMKQLNIPLSPLETSQGMTSEVIALGDPARGVSEYTGWLRTTSATGDVVYAGLYTVASPPRSAGPCVKVVFPVPRGNTTVVLRPEARADGSLVLLSDGRGFGDVGFYRIVAAGEDRARARYIRAMKETIEVGVDDRGVLRAEHVFRFFRLVILRLHYKITPLVA